jgi:hypothetical protein
MAAPAATIAAGLVEALGVGVGFSASASGGIVWHCIFMSHLHNAHGRVALLQLHALLRNL